MNAATVSEVEAAVRALEAQWNRNDMPGMAMLWDADDSEPLYLAEEEPDFARDRAALEHYWRRTQALNMHIAVRYRDIAVKALDVNLALASWQMHWDIALIDRPKPIGGEVRVAAVFRRRDASWKLCAYIEAPLAPILYLRRFYEASVTPGFESEVARR